MNPPNAKKRRNYRRCLIRIRQLQRQPRRIGMSSHQREQQCSDRRAANRPPQPAQQKVKPQRRPPRSSSRHVNTNCPCNHSSRYPLLCAKQHCPHPKSLSRSQTFSQNKIIGRNRRSDKVIDATGQTADNPCQPNESIFLGPCRRGPVPPPVHGRSQNHQPRQQRCPVPKWKTLQHQGRGRCYSNMSELPTEFQEYCASAGSGVLNRGPRRKQRLILLLFSQRSSCSPVQNSYVKFRASALFRETLDTARPSLNHQDSQNDHCFA